MIMQIASVPQSHSRGVVEAAATTSQQLASMIHTHRNYSPALLAALIGVTFQPPAPAPIPPAAPLPTPLPAMAPPPQQVYMHPVSSLFGLPSQQITVAMDSQPLTAD
jgi:hypothetical protein